MIRRTHQDKPPIRERVDVARMAEHVPADCRALARHFFGVVPDLSKRDCNDLADEVNEWRAMAPLRVLHALQPTHLPHRREHR